ncbi:unnamed protein product [Rangifer tarandus platyrhynchus]|uniref:Uncharacterized protein n=1 Tax=Rangifer tarandus platyrhynchus TaxID=3082113 RepID=A0ABN8YWH3_RANTA|nr:unnamed protein product [Rangifer tarandus platyrhynchus]
MPTLSLGILLDYTVRTRTPELTVQIARVHFQQLYQPFPGSVLPRANFLAIEYTPYPGLATHKRSALPPEAVATCGFQSCTQGGDWFLFGRHRVGPEMASPAADFPGQRLCSGRRGRPSLAGRGGAPVADLHSSWTAASSTSPGDTSQPLAAPPAGARRGWNGERAARRRFPADLPAAPTRAAPKGFIPDTGSRRPPLALRETRKAGPPLLSSQSPPITVSAPQQGPPGRATTKLCLGPSEWSPVKLVSRDNPQEPGEGGQGLKPQINDISVASNAGTINPIIYRVASGLSFKLPSQTMAGQSPCQVFRRDRDRARGQIGLWWPALWDSPPVTYHLQGGSWGTLPGARSSAPEDLFAPKAEQGSGRALAWKQKIEAWGASTAASPFVTLATHQILGVSDVGGQTGASVSGGERAVPSPSPTRAVSVLDEGEAAVPASRAAAACLSPWQPGQKTDLPVSRL